MDEKETQTAFMSALVTEHFVMQTAANGTISEAASRTSLFVMALSSALVAMGFASHSREVFMPFVATVLPTVFLLGVFTFIRLVDTALESQQFLASIARIRGYYRTLGPLGAKYFAEELGRWPEAKSVPSLALGPLIAFLGTSAIMVAVIDSIVAGAGVTLLAADLMGKAGWIPVLIGAVTASVLMVGFYKFETWRFTVFAAEQSFEWRGENGLPEGVTKR